MHGRWMNLHVVGSSVDDAKATGGGGDGEGLQFCLC